MIHSPDKKCKKNCQAQRWKSQTAILLLEDIPRIKRKTKKILNIFIKSVFPQLYFHIIHKRGFDVIIAINTEEEFNVEIEQ